MKFLPHELFDCAAREILTPSHEDWGRNAHLSHNARSWYCCDALGEAAYRLGECEWYGNPKYYKLVERIQGFLATSGVKCVSTTEFEDFERRSETEYCSPSQGARFLFLDFMANVLEDQPELLNVEL